MSPFRWYRVVLCVLVAASVLPSLALSQAQNRKPNIVFIMGDDVGWSNIGVYNQGIMAGRTPNLDKMASEGMRFTDYYAEASCHSLAGSRASRQG